MEFHPLELCGIQPAYTRMHQPETPVTEMALFFILAKTVIIHSYYLSHPPKNEK